MSEQHMTRAGIEQFTEVDKAASRIDVGGGQNAHAGSQLEVVEPMKRLALALSLLAGWHLFFPIRSHVAPPYEAPPLQDNNMRPAQMPRR